MGRAALPTSNGHQCSLALVASEERKEVEGRTFISNGVQRRFPPAFDLALFARRLGESCRVQRIERVQYKEDDGITSQSQMDALPRGDDLRHSNAVMFGVNDRASIRKVWD